MNTKRKAPECDGTPRKKTTRHRAALACEECRSRKRRCDGATPACGGCVKRITACIYASEIQAETWRDSMIQSLKSRLEDLEKGEEPLPAAEKHASGTQNAMHTPTSPTNHGVESSMSGARTQNNQPLHSPPAALQITPGADLRDQLDNVDTQRRTNGDPGLSTPKGRHAGGLELCGVERLMEPIDQGIDSRTSRMKPTETLSWPGVSAFREPSSTRIIDCSCSLLLGAMRCRLPLRQHADDLVTLYFARVHRIYPIIHENTFRRQYQYLWQLKSRTAAPSATSCCGICKQKSQGKTFPAMVHAIFAMASLFESGSPEQDTQRADDYFRLVQEIDLLDILDYEVGIELVQLGLLMGFYLQSTERFSKCWNMTGLTIRMAQNMGLQLSLSDARRKGLFRLHATQLECEMRIRVWYGCVLLDREISMSFGRPLMIVTGCEGIRLPEAIDDHRLAEEMGQWNLQPAGSPSLLESYIQTIKLYDILKHVLDREELKVASDVCPDVRSLLSLDTMIMEWRDSLPSYLRYMSLSENASTTETHETHGIAKSQLHFSAQAKRLHTRFLHVRVLILRPALDLLFQRQQHTPPVLNQRSLEAKVQDLTLSDIATQCALSANSLVQLLNIHSQTKSLVAWWYNISYLHTSGSTLLMAQMCTFNDVAMSSEFSRSWDLCLRCLSRYTSVSSIAKRSLHLLKESAKCLLPDGLNQKQQPLPPLRTQGSATQETCQSQANKNLPPVNNCTANLTDEVWRFAQPTTNTEGRLTVDIMPEPALESANLHGPDAGFWSNAAGESSYWPFMPFLSQLETLPTNLDLSNLE